MRGCANLCRFCWAGYNYLPVRAFPTDRILHLAEQARVQGYLGRAAADGLAPAAQGAMAPNVPPGGYYVLPTLVADVPPQQYPAAPVGA